ncbi:hypothetical protein L2D14_07240 [Thalassospiraceae bacterium LMO-JJ14]|nr:hypothetical protein L2D14_07240 [Thalassospiraceae bacterium LMO-JJ14]
MLVLLLVILSAAGCTPPRDAVPLGGTLSVLGPDQRFIEAVSQGEIPPGWEISGEMPPGALAIHQIDRFRALGVKPASTPFALLRHTNASLLATPYLSWAWHMQPPGHIAGGSAHPVRIIVGLVGPGKKAGKSWWSFGGDGKVTRIIQMVWNGTALGRGSVVGPRIDEDRPESARYIARGGPEQANRWWVDTVDLSLIHRQVWPEDDPAKMDIRYIGVAVQAAAKSRGGQLPGEMNIAAIRLTR